MIYEGVPSRIRKMKTVHDALNEGSWVRDFGLELTEEQVLEFFNIWDRMATVELDDTATWMWEKSGCFSTRSAYAAMFWGREVSPTANFTWKSRAPLQCKFFTWLAIKNRC